MPYVSGVRGFSFAATWGPLGGHGCGRVVVVDPWKLTQYPLHNFIGLLPVSFIIGTMQSSPNPFWGAQTSYLK